MSKPAQPFNPYTLQRAISRQSWLIFALLVISVITDLVTQQTNFLITKNLLAGSLVCWIGQLIFAKISLSLTGYRQRRQVVNRFYQAHMMKWLITIAGFAVIFIFLEPLSPLWVFIGFIIIQVSYLIITYKHRV